MQSDSVTVHLAGPSDAEAITEILADAFQSDPPFQWISVSADSWAAAPRVLIYGVPFPHA